MEIGILGLAGSGKSTLFRLLTAQESNASSAARRDQIVLGIAKVPDPRLDTLSALYSPKKHTPARIRYVDVPRVPAEHGREGSLNLPELRSMDALMVVLRAFHDSAVPHPMGKVDPMRDLIHIEEEFLLQDQMIVERRLERLERDLKKRRLPELLAEREILQDCLAALENGCPLRQLVLDETHLKVVRGFTFLSLKPLLAVVNVDEAELEVDVFVSPAWQEWQRQPTVASTRACATIESELAALSDDEAAEFMNELGIKDRALDRIIRSSYSLLGLVSFFTVGEDECRAWSIPEGTAAVTAANSIHSDLQRGFIRAEVVPWDELVDAGSLGACRQRGTLRLEGKTYLVQNGEVVHFRFNV